MHQPRISHAQCESHFLSFSLGLHLEVLGEHYSTGEGMMFIIFFTFIRAGEARGCVVSGLCYHGRVSAAHKCSITGEGEKLLPQTQVQTPFSYLANLKVLNIWSKYIVDWQKVKSALKVRIYAYAVFLNFPGLFIWRSQIQTQIPLPWK